MNHTHTHARPSLLQCPGHAEAAACPAVPVTNTCCLKPVDGHQMETLTETAAEPCVSSRDLNISLSSDNCFHMWPLSSWKGVLKKKKKSVTFHPGSRLRHVLISYRVQ